MKVKLLQDWAGKPAGAIMELEDAKARRVIATGLVEAASKLSEVKKRTKKESVSFNPGGI